MLLKNGQIQIYIVVTISAKILLTTFKSHMHIFNISLTAVYGIETTDCKSTVT